MSQYSFRVLRRPTLLNEVFRLRRKVFVDEKGWLESSMEDYEFDPHDIFSQQLVAINETGEVVGCTRLVYDSVLGFPFEKVQSLGCDYERDKLFEVSRLAVLLKERGQRSVVLLGLTRLVCRVGLAIGFKHWCAVVDLPVARLLKQLGFQFVYEGEPVFYLGSMSLPLICDMAVTKEVLFSAKLDTILADQIEEAYREDVVQPKMA